MGQAPPSDLRSAYRRILIPVGVGLAAGALLEWVPESPSTWRWLPLGIVYLLGGRGILADALATLREGRLSIDALMGAAAVGAALVGQPLEGAVLIFLFSLSNYLEAVALGRTREALASLRELHPSTATRLGAADAEEVVPVEQLRPGDRIRVRPGERVPADGSVLRGRSRVDQAPITGESVPVMKEEGDPVFAGTMNQDGALDVAVERDSGETLLARVVRLVEEAREQRAPVQQFIDRFAHPYTVGVFVATALVATLPPLVAGAPWDDSLYRAITLLVVASPCALVISTPSALLSAMASGARHGVLFKGGDHLDRAGRVDAVAFDKTGTLTLGTPRLLELVGADGSASERSDLLRMAAAVELPSEHHLARAVVEAAREEGLAVGPASDFRAFPGIGVQGRIDGTLGWVGNQEMAGMMEAAVPSVLRGWAEDRHQAGASVVFLGEQGRVRGALALGDGLKPGAAEALLHLRDGGVGWIEVLSGDHPETVAAVTAELSVDRVRAGLLPEQKVGAVQRLEEEGWRVAMVGDGVNDAPALASATLGIAMGAGGTDVAIETADVVLIGDDLSRVHFALMLGRRARRMVRHNVWFSVGWMAALVIITLTVGLPLPLAVVGHEGSTLLVALNGLRLLRIQPEAVG